MHQPLPGLQMLLDLQNLKDLAQLQCAVGMHLLEPATGLSHGCGPAALMVTGLTHTATAF